MKVILNLSCPAINESFDFISPSNITIDKLREIILDNLYDVSENLYKPTGDEILIHKQNGKVLRPNLTLEEENVTNGHTIFII